MTDRKIAVDLCSLGIQIRQAYRLVVAYQRKVLEAYALVNDLLAEEGFTRSGWLPRHVDFPPTGSKSPVDRWAWDYVPLYNVRLWWRNTPKDNVPGSIHVFLDHVADTGFEHFDSGEEEPQPGLFADTSSCNTVWRGHWLGISPRGKPFPEEIFSEDWEDIVASVFGGASKRTIWLESNITAKLVEQSKREITAGSLCVALTDLGSAQDFREKLVDPLLGRVTRLRDSYNK